MFFLQVTRKLKDEGGLTVPLCTTNRINMPHVVEAVLERGDADLVTMSTTRTTRTPMNRRSIRSSRNMRKHGKPTNRVKLYVWSAVLERGDNGLIGHHARRVAYREGLTPQQRRAAV